MREITLKINAPDGSQLEAKAPFGASLRETLLKKGESPYRKFFQHLNCHGLGLCGRCKVWVKEGETFWERRSCQIRCFQDLEINLK